MGLLCPDKKRHTHIKKSGPPNPRNKTVAGNGCVMSQNLCWVSMENPKGTSNQFGRGAPNFETHSNDGTCKKSELNSFCHPQKRGYPQTRARLPWSKLFVGHGKRTPMQPMGCFMPTVHSATHQHITRFKDRLHSNGEGGGKGTPQLQLI